MKKSEVFNEGYRMGLEDVLKSLKSMLNESADCCTGETVEEEKHGHSTSEEVIDSLEEPEEEETPGDESVNDIVDDMVKKNGKPEIEPSSAYGELSDEEREQLGELGVEGGEDGDAMDDEAEDKSLVDDDSTSWFKEGSPEEQGPDLADFEYPPAVKELIDPEAIVEYDDPAEDWDPFVDALGELAIVSERGINNDLVYIENDENDGFSIRFNNCDGSDIDGFDEKDADSFIDASIEGCGDHCKITAHFEDKYGDNGGQPLELTAIVRTPAVEDIAKEKESDKEILDAEPEDLTKD